MGTISKLMKRFEARFGKEVLMSMSQRGEGAIPVVSTGSLGLDMALGIGGLPVGRVVEIYGPESSGKTTLTLHGIANNQKQGGLAAFIDAEHALDLGYARALGVDTDRLLVSQPDCGEQALEICEFLARSQEVTLIVVDSVAALTPRAEINGDMGDSHVGLHARLMSQALRKLTAAAHKSGTTIIFINQLRHKIGVMFGSPETTTGGNALKFYASVRLDIRRIGAVKQSDNIIGNRTRVKVAKNKLSPPFKIAEFDLLYGEGIAFVGEILDHGVRLGRIDKAGSWYSRDGERLGQGRESAICSLRDKPGLVETIRGEILAAHNGEVQEPPVVVAA